MGPAANSGKETLLARKTMVEEQIAARGVKDRRILDAFLEVPRHRFVEEYLKYKAYEDYPLSIGYGQTISQPYMVALMTEALAPKPTDRILEIGTGSGYQAAILSRLCARVFSIERIAALASRARKTLDELGYFNVSIRIGDGTLGWPTEAPFDGIIVTAGAPRVPEALLSQLVEGGRLVIPVGETGIQDLKRYTVSRDGVREESLGGCRFVRLIGKDGWQE
ncbi:MAG TPA: protein-L-isoaspartate(D-aspartate) O-methyltransferase [Deltaproteobacteria bacterium]|nr:protein-L-isoaspartate(D-aspartate) O-methyltransferase [Deltaproteobacteria bacterium]HPP81278.1 protein-L-isoaspartate(D-aspartate) O-methyltransferase [Deltaproteobacteria bacterium]